MNQLLSAELAVSSASRFVGSMCSQLCSHMCKRAPRTLGILTALLTVMSLAALPLRAQEEATPPLRRVLVVDSDTVQLGQPLGALTRYIAYPGDTIVRFPPGTFEGSDAAMAFLDPGGTVRRIGFLFGEQHNIDILLGSLYRNHGREPRYSNLPIPEGIRETWTWSDRETELAFTRFTPAQSRVVGILLVTNLKP